VSRSDRVRARDGRHTLILKMIHELLVDVSAGNAKALKQLHRVLSARLEGIGSRRNLTVTW